MPKENNTKPAASSTPPIQFNRIPSFEKRFRRLLKKQPSLNNDLDALLQLLEADPQTGTPLGRDCYKIRLAIKSKQAGKSGGERVVTCVKIVANEVTFLTIYDKSEDDTITNSELSVLLKEMAG